MRWRTRQRIREAALAGRTVEDIAEEFRCSVRSISEILANPERTPETAPPKLPPQPVLVIERSPLLHATGIQTLADATQVTRASLLHSCEVLAATLLRLDKLMESAIGLAPDGTVEPDQVVWGQIRELTIARAVAVDKQAEVLRQLRALESESAESLEMAFTIVEELPDGRRRVVGQPPELEALDVRGMRATIDALPESAGASSDGDSDGR